MPNNTNSLEIDSLFDMIKVLRVFLREIFLSKWLSFLSKKVALKFRYYFHFFMTILSDTFSVLYDNNIIIILRLTRGFEIFCHIEEKVAQTYRKERHLVISK